MSNLDPFVVGRGLASLLCFRKLLLLDNFKRVTLTGLQSFHYGLFSMVVTDR